MRIITISREFGSGGRELGKRLADVLGFDYYDREIIQSIAKNKNMNEKYIQDTLDNHGWQTIPLNYGSTFMGVTNFNTNRIEILLEQKKVIEEIAKAGKDCIIVGRNADVLLSDYHPFNIFVCASIEAKVGRCIKHSKEGENTSFKAMAKMIKKIDKHRAKTREIITDSKFGVSGSYNITVNTTNWDLKALSHSLGNFILDYFENPDCHKQHKKED